MFGSSKAFSSFSTNNLEKTQEFYRNILGLNVAQEGDMALRINLASGAIIFVYEKENHVPASFTILNFPVDDIDQAVDGLVNKGIKLERYEGFEQDNKGIMRTHDPKKGCPAAIAWFKDPAGNVLSIIQENR